MHNLDWANAREHGNWPSRDDGVAGDLSLRFGWYPEEFRGFRIL
jgi:hypothetical protein